MLDALRSLVWRALPRSPEEKPPEAEAKVAEDTQALSSPPTPLVPQGTIPSAQLAAPRRPVSPAARGGDAFGWQQMSSPSSLARVLADAEEVLNPAHAVRRQIAEAVSGPAYEVFRLVAAMYQRALPWLEPECLPRDPLLLLTRGLGRLSDQADRLREAIEDPSTAEGTLTLRRDDIGKTLLFFQQCGQKDGNKALADVYSIVEDERVRHLSTAEFMATLAVLGEDGHLPNGGSEFLKARYELARCDDPDAAETRALRALLSSALQAVALDDAVAEVRHQLGHARAVRAREAAAFWKEASCQPEGIAMRRRLSSLRIEAHRQSALGDRLASMMRPASAASALLCSAESEAVRAAIHDIVRLVRRAKAFVDEALAVQSLVRDSMSTARSKHAQEARGQRAGPCATTLVSASTGQPVDATDLARHRVEAQATLGRAAETLLGWASDAASEISVGAFCSGSKVEAALQPHLDSMNQLLNQGVALSAADKSLLVRAGDVVEIAAHLRVSEGASPVLSEQVRQREEQKLLYAWLAQEYALLETMLPATVKRLKKRQRRAATPDARAVEHAAEITPTQRSTQPLGDACSAGDFASQMTQTWLDPRFEQSDANGQVWTTVGHHAQSRPLSAAGMQKVGEQFYRGTFTSPVQSLIYHYKKHSRQLGCAVPPLNEGQLLGYMASAQAAEAKWPAAVAAGNGYLAENRTEPSLSVRVIDDEDVYLVMTDEPTPRVVSFRDRKRVGRL